MHVLEHEQSAARSPVDIPGTSFRDKTDNQSMLTVERCRLFAGLSPDDYTAIHRAAVAKRFARGEMLYLEGDSITQVILLASGSVKISKLGTGGEEVILRLVPSGEVLGAVCLFSSGTHGATAEVFRDCRALAWEARSFKALLTRCPMLNQNLVAILEERLRELEDRFREVATNRVGPRVALQLLRLLKSIGRPAEGGVEVCLSREELAQMTGTTLYTVSRLLSAWEERGLVKPRREVVEICDVESLRAVSEED
jgi:CRP/FNR family transcriptional regulator, nitrogen oxide reductase regulator